MTSKTMRLVLDGHSGLPEGSPLSSTAEVALDQAMEMHPDLWTMAAEQLLNPVTRAGVARWIGKRLRGDGIQSIEVQRMLGALPTVNRRK